MVAQARQEKKMKAKMLHFRVLTLPLHTSRNLGTHFATCCRGGRKMCVQGPGKEEEREKRGRCNFQHQYIQFRHLLHP